MFHSRAFVYTCTFVCLSLSLSLSHLSLLLYYVRSCDYMFQSHDTASTALYTSPGDVGSGSHDLHATPTESKLLSYACSAVHGFFRSISLSVQSSLQDTLRSAILSLLCRSLPLVKFGQKK